MMIGILRPPAPRPVKAFSIMPKGKPHLRLVHVPYGVGTLDKEGCRSLFIVTDGSAVLDHVLVQEPGRQAYWVFVIDVSKEAPLGGPEKPMPTGWDYRNLMRRP